MLASEALQVMAVGSMLLTTAGTWNFWGPPVSALLPGWTRGLRGRTWPAHRPHSQIDHILVRGARFRRSWTVHTDASDHLPLVTEVAD